MVSNVVKEAGIPDWAGRLVLGIQTAITGLSGSVATLKGASMRLAASTSYANDAAAQAGGVAIGELYRNGSVVQVRVT